MRFLLLITILSSCSTLKPSREIASKIVEPDFECGKVFSISSSFAKLEIHKSSSASESKLRTSQFRGVASKELESEPGVNLSYSCQRNGACEDFKRYSIDLKFKDRIDAEKLAHLAYDTDSFLCFHPSDKSYRLEVRREY